MTPAQEKLLFKRLSDLEVKVSVIQGHRTPRPRKTREDIINETIKGIQEKLKRKSNPASPAKNI